ncbi:hypothetical protein [Nocardioides litoris]|uniref:hypothetical protein n=1 Tax=Nocardioides litoris TaxID=1926648 RepID=UPI00111DF380|nr:hypothetical protein [Nocardioides litoris]
MTHLGRKVSDLLDGQLSPAETEAAWAHVHVCHACRDDVEREGWVKTQLVALAHDPGPAACSAPDGLKGALLGLPPERLLGPCDDLRHRARPRVRGGVAGIAALGGGAAGAAVMGVLALGPAPAADLPSPADRRQQPVTQQAPQPAFRGPVPVRRGTTP